MKYFAVICLALLSLSHESLGQAGSAGSATDSYFYYSTNSPYYYTVGSANDWYGDMSSTGSYSYSYSYSMNANQDIGSAAGQSVEAQAVLANSANLTLQNAKCDEIIAQNLQNHTSDKDTQPVIPTNIDMKFIMITLNDIDDVNGIVSMTARVDFRWFDKRLALKDNTTCKGQSLLVKTTDLWFPYFIVQNGASNVFYPDSWEKFPTSLRSDGFVDWRIAFKFEVSCDMDFTIFPFDTQYCKVLIQTPHYGAAELNFTVKDTARGVVVFSAAEADHPLWEIKGQAVQFTSKVPGIVFWFEFKRKWLYFIYTIAIPVLAVCLLTATTFIVPAEGEEKMSTVISALLSFFLLYLLFIGAIPADSTKLPMLMVFFSVQILLTTVQVLICSVILRILGLEQAEEKLEKENEELEEENTRRITPHGVGSAGNPNKEMAAAFLYAGGNVKNNAIMPITEDMQAVLPKEPIIGRRRKRCITAHRLNDIVLVVYIACVVVSVIAFVGNMIQIYRTQVPDVDYSDIQEYKIDE